jgi:phage-related protein
MLIDLIVGITQAIIPQLPTLLLGVVQGIIGVIKTLAAPENMQAVLMTAIQLMMAIVQAVPQIAVALIEALPDIIVGIVEFLSDPANIMMIIEAAVQLFMGLVQAVPKILGALFKAFGDLFGKLWERCAQLFKDFAANFGEAISGVFKAAVNGVLAFIEGLINGPIDIINAFADGINWVLGGLTAGAVQIGKLGRVSLPRLAEGGLVARSTLANIGEDGKEAVIPLERNTDNWAGLLAHTLADEFEQEGLTAGGNITVYMTNNINNNLDADEIGQRLMTSIRRAA